MSNRARQHDLACIPLPFQTHHEYRTQLPVKDILADKSFFLAVRNNLRPGDKITVCRYTSPAFEHLCEVADARVVSVSSDGVILHAGDVTAIAAPEDPAKEETVPNANYISGDGDVRWNVGRKIHEVVLDGEVIATAEDKKSAQAIATGQAPLPEQII